MAQAVQYVEFGGPEVLTLQEVTSPSPGAGEVAVRVAAAGINPIDAKVLSGLRPTGPITAPRGIGGDAAGTVIAVGPDTEGVAVGQDVIVFGVTGTCATELTAPIAHVQPRPPQVSAAAGAALGVPAGTAYQTLALAACRPGRHGARARRIRIGRAGGRAVRDPVGRTGRGHGIPRRHDRLRALGAIPVAYGGGLAARVRRRCPGRHHRGDRHRRHRRGDRDLAAARTGPWTGRDARAREGCRGPRHPRIPGRRPRPAHAASATLRAEAMPVTLALMAAGRFTVELGPTFPLADAAAALRALAAGVDGKITLVP
ncbi:alcohol dehydrogenase catalytic domain-containing protein [Microbacterium elymi]|uniref:Alcohol dehydrogenase catalytic domain-containing protein n=1 Tax=Microbacterium elymi TaxID=2909587 RepID=A0ABY5NKB9_9MICO|nr:alcohol dehydrogenase catalytic domain-containing protein [Microbacterium elymi]UUT35617.1 alcohol dehydrogenase catalytic domain-containing protein [Microbacterium elymi]